MNRSKLMLGTLQRAHGEWVSRAELFDDAGCFYLSNNASSELRADGYEVEHRKIRGLVSYRLVGSGGGADGPGTDDSPGSTAISSRMTASARSSTPPLACEAAPAGPSLPAGAATLFDELDSAA